MVIERAVLLSRGWVGSRSSRNNPTTRPIKSALVQGGSARSSPVPFMLHAYLAGASCCRVAPRIAEAKVDLIRGIGASGSIARALYTSLPLAGRCRYRISATSTVHHGKQQGSRRPQHIAASHSSHRRTVHHMRMTTKKLAKAKYKNSPSRHQTPPLHHHPVPSKRVPKCKTHAA